MGIELFRDWVIIISGIIVIAGATFITVVTYMLYRRINRILKSAETAAEKVGEISKPLINAAGVIEGIILGFRAVNKIFRKGGRNGR